MTHRFILFSQEVKNFVIEIKASPQSTFRQLHDIIQSHCQYVESGNHHFLICDLFAENMMINTDGLCCQ